MTPVVKRTAPAAKIYAIVNVVWLLVLTFAFYSYWIDWPVVGRTPGKPAEGLNLNSANLARKLSLHDPIGGIVPAYVAWAGALGGVVISLIGCAKWSRDWDPKWNVWHALRPIMGAVSGSVGFIIVVLVLRMAGGTESTLDRLPTNPVSQATFFMIAFLVGFRDRLFLDLISKVTKTLFTTGEEDPERPTYTVEPEELIFPDTSVGSSSQRLVRVELTNPKATSDLPDGWFEVEPSVAGAAVAFTSTTEDSQGLAAQYRDIVVQFTPPTDGSHTANLRVIIGDVERRVVLVGAGIR